MFGFAKLQDLVTLFSILEREGISIDNVKEFVRQTILMEQRYKTKMEKRSREIDKIWRKNTRRCPICKEPLYLSPIRIPKGKANVNGYTCRWYCSGEKCTFEEFSHANYMKNYRKIMED